MNIDEVPGMSISRLLLLGLLYLPIGFVIGHFYTLYTGDVNKVAAIDAQSLSPWEQRYYKLEKRVKEMSQLVDNFYSSGDERQSGGKQVIDTKKVIASFHTMVDEQYNNMESDVKQNIIDMCRSVEQQLGK